MKVMLPINCLGFFLLLYTLNKQSQCSRMPVCDYLQQAETPDSDNLMCDNNGVSVCVTSKKRQFQTNFGGLTDYYYWLRSPFAGNFLSFWKLNLLYLMVNMWMCHRCAVAGLMKTSQTPLHHASILLHTGTDTPYPYPIPPLSQALEMENWGSHLEPPCRVCALQTEQWGKIKYVRGFYEHWELGMYIIKILSIQYQYNNVNVICITWKLFRLMDLSVYGIKGVKCSPSLHHWFITSLQNSSICFKCIEILSKS